jgi:transposase
MLRHTHPSRATGPSVIYDTRSISHEPRRAGLDVDARSVKGCAIDRETGEILRQSLAASDAGIAEWVSGLPGPVLVVYEAGPTGFGLARLALLGQITLVRVPGRADEAARDLVRAREDVRADLMRARHRVSKLLLRHGLVYSGGHAWTDAHHTWLHRQRFDDAALQAAYEAGLETAELTLDRRNRLDSRITDLAATGPVRPGGAGPDVSAWNLGADRLRPPGGNRRLDPLHRQHHRRVSGPGPSEHSSGASRSQGGITKTGNTHARRLLVEAAWHHRRPYNNASRDMRSRWDLADEASRVRGHQGNHRLHRKWEQFEARHKRRVITNVAVARELA